MHFLAHIRNQTIYFIIHSAPWLRTNFFFSLLLVTFCQSSCFVIFVKPESKLSTLSYYSRFPVGQMLLPLLHLLIECLKSKLSVSYSNDGNGQKETILHCSQLQDDCDVFK